MKKGRSNYVDVILKNLFADHPFYSLYHWALRGNTFSDLIGYIF